MRELIIGKNDAGQRLDKFITKAAPMLPKNLLYKYLRIKRIKINGKKEILNINIKPEIVDPDDIEMLSDILVAAVNEAIKRVETTNSTEMDKITKGMNMPGLF